MSRSATVFIGNIPYDATEQDLREAFGAAGTISSLRLVYDKDTKQPKGYAFCDYADPEMAMNCMRTLSEVEVNGRRLRIDLADNALRGKGGGKGDGGAPMLALALPAPDGSGGGQLSRPRSFVPSVPAAPPPGPAPKGPLMPAGLVPLRPLGPPGQPGAGATGGAADAGQTPEEIIAQVCAHAEIAQTMAAMPQAQLQLCLGAMQKLAVEAPERARSFLQEHPQLCYALLHGQLVLGLTLDPALPPDDAEILRLRMEAVRRFAPNAPAMPMGLGGMLGAPGMLPGMQGVPGMPMPPLLGLGGAVPAMPGLSGLPVPGVPPVGLTPKAPSMA